LDFALARREELVTIRIYSKSAKAKASHQRLCKDCNDRYAQDGLDRCNRCFNVRTKSAPHPFMQASILEAMAAKAARKTRVVDSWWTRHAAPNADRSEFVAAVNHRSDERRQKLASSAGIAITRPTAALGGAE